MILKHTHSNRSSLPQIQGRETCTEEMVISYRYTRDSNPIVSIMSKVNLEEENPVYLNISNRWYIL